MELDLAGRSAAVMASSGGLGLAIARALAAEGVNVVVCGRDGPAVERAATEATAQALATARVVPATLDVATADGPARLVQTAVDAFGGLDILVTNSGGPPIGPILDFDDDAWQAAFELTLLSVARGARAALPHLSASSQPRIVCIGSSSVVETIRGLGFSNALRPAIRGLVKTLADELGPLGITVNLIAPGRFATARVRSLDESRGAARGLSADAVRAETEAAIPLGRYGEPAELAEVAVFLCSRAGRYVSGTATIVDGGMVRAV